MKVISMRPAFVALAAGLILAPGAASAESLAGQVGDQRYSTSFAYSKGPCEKVFQDYVKAAGHSAYAQTHRGRMTEAVFCGRAYNAPSQKEAERRALDNCQSVFKKYKVKTTGPCSIYASK